MPERLFGYALQYSGYLLEVGVVSLLVLRGRWRRLLALTLYVLLLYSVDALVRPFVLFRFGVASNQYAYIYWLTDVLLALAAFALVCAFFRRACIQEEKMWRFLRLLLWFVFILVLGISYFSLAKNYGNLFSFFITEFSQNLYFTCLVLNTLLYILIQQVRTADEELGLLVCGLGIQFAGFAACLALFQLTSHENFARSLGSLIGPLCNLGMLLTWLYATWRPLKTREVPAYGRETPALAVETVTDT